MSEFSSSKAVINNLKPGAVDYYNPETGEILPVPHQSGDRVDAKVSFEQKDGSIVYLHLLHAELSGSYISL